MPAAPMDQTQNGGGTSIHMKVLDQGAQGYIVMYNDFPGGAALDGNMREQALNEYRKGLVRGQGNVTVESETRINYGEHPGREFVASMTVIGQRTKTKIRIYLVGNRLYQLMAIGGAAFLESNESRQFFDSFELTN
jgi:hypothetical protein